MTTTHKMGPGEKETHITYMREALAMAQYALDNSETPVGCIILHLPSSTIIGRGYNHTNQTFNGTRHAEFVAVNQILTTRLPPSSHPCSEKSKDGSREGGGGGKRFGVEVFKDCVLYVTVEPCIMCASLLRQIGIRKVYFGAGNERFGGTGGVLSIHEGNGRLDQGGESLEDREEEGGDVGGERVRGEGDYEVSGGWLREEAIVMLRRFYVQENGRAPEEKRGKEGRVLRLDVEGVGVDVDGGNVKDG